MSEKSYSKREQDHFFTELFTRMDKQDIILTSILSQTTATNGRVALLEAEKKVLLVALEKLESKTEILNNERWKMVGIGIGISFVIAFIPFVYTLVKDRNTKHENISAIVNQAVSQSLKEQSNVAIQK